jgi:hypothetical protein
MRTPVDLGIAAIQPSEYTAAQIFTRGRHINGTNRKIHWHFRFKIDPGNRVSLRFNSNSG